jgi:hypothetical protein
MKMMRTILHAALAIVAAIAMKRMNSIARMTRMMIAHGDAGDDRHRRIEMIQRWNSSCR